MRIVLNPTGISPHQLPLARAIAKRVGVDNFRYVCQDELEADRVRMGWSNDAPEPWVLRAGEGIDVRNEWLENADLLVSYIRNIDLFERRSKKGLRTFYSSERWFKPTHGIPGCLRLLSPSYFRMARRFLKLFDYPDFRYLPQGKWAEKDMSLLCRMMWRTMPKDKVIPWGYFVAPSTKNAPSIIHNSSFKLHNCPTRVLWVGRMIGWKRVDTIVRAVKSLDSDRFALTLVGSGDKRTELEKLAGGAKNITFKNNLPIDEIRNEMRANDVYVLASTGEEGWGAALNEAMEEGMLALGTFEAGSSSYMLPDTHKFHAGDWRRLAVLLQQVADGKMLRFSIGDWTAAKAAERLLAQ